MSVHSLKDWIEIHNRQILVLMASAIFVLSLLTLICERCAIPAAILSILMVLVQSVRRDSYAVDILDDEWKLIGGDVYEYRLKLAPGFQMSPFGVFQLKDGRWSEFLLQKEYSEDGSEIVLTMNDGPEWERAKLIIGGPVSK